RRTLSRVRIPGPSPLRSLYSVRFNRTSQPARGSACSVRRQPVLFIAACSSGAHCHLSLLSVALFPFLHVPGLVVAHRTSMPQDTRRYRRSPADPAVAARGSAPGATELAPSILACVPSTRPGHSLPPPPR